MLDYDNYDDYGVRPRRHKQKFTGKVSRKVEADVREVLVAFRNEPAGFNPTYLANHSDHLEYAWLVEALGGFYDDNLILDVLHAVKAGKEANVYCCQAVPATGHELLAAKIYRPRMHRNLKNDALYREGRELLGDDGKPIRKTHEARAVAKKTRFGAKLQITSWIEFEYQTLCRLSAAGVDVPQPLAQDGRAILMEYLGEENAPAPAIKEVSLTQAEARPLCERLLHDVERMLSCELIHGDLSAYNVLYWDGEVKIIDFPQAINARTHRTARLLLTRDIERICQYFARYRVAPKASPAQIAESMWRRCMGEDYGDVE